MSSEDTSLSNRILPPLCSLDFESRAFQAGTSTISASNFPYYTNNQPSYTPTVSSQPHNTDHGFPTEKHSLGSPSLDTNLIAATCPSIHRVTADSYPSEASTSSHEAAIERYHSPSSPTEGTSAQHILAEKRRRNAGASARFRDRRKQREREILERCVLLEDRVKELEHANPFTQQMAELSNELKQAQLEKANALSKLKVLENEVAWLRELIVTKGETLPPFTSTKN